MKLNIATPICKVCLKDIRDESISTAIDGNEGICRKCFKSLSPKMERFTINGIKGMFLYEYSEAAKSMIYNFKGCFDYELREVFLSRQKNYLKLRYRNWILIPAPSFKEKDKERGFNHVVEMFRILDLPIVEALIKNKDIKQASLKKKNREEVGQYLEWNNEVDISGKKVLFIDDILTTGSTAKAACELIKKHRPKKIEILIGFHTKNKKEFSFFERIKRSFVAYDLS